MASSLCLRAASHRAAFLRPFCRRSLAAAAAPAEDLSRLDSGKWAVPMDTPPVQQNAGFPPFSSLSKAISPATLQAITVKPFTLTHMTSVQASVLPLLPLLAEPYDASREQKHTRDLLVRAKTGTGKTLAFLVPAIEARLKAITAHADRAVAASGLNSDRTLWMKAAKQFAREHVGTLIISPTRELATQIANEALRLTHHHEDFEVRLFVGGQSKGQQMRDWMRGRRDIVVTTPGRMLDLLQAEKDLRSGISKTQMVWILVYVFK